MIRIFYIIIVVFIETSLSCTFDYDVYYEDCGEVNLYDDANLTPEDCMNHCNMFTESGCQCWSIRQVEPGKIINFKISTIYVGTLYKNIYYLVFTYMLYFFIQLL